MPFHRVAGVGVAQQVELDFGVRVHVAIIAPAANPRDCV
jgi:hypothetical protein